VTFLNRIVDVVSTGSTERIRILKEFNLVFKEVYLQGELQHLCHVTTSPGNPKFKHELSTFYLRSGFKITIGNDRNLSKEEIIEYSKFVIESKPFVRQLMSLGYDTLILRPQNNYAGISELEVALKTIANFQNYMLNQ
jgi:hypothetical protein